MDDIRAIRTQLGLTQIEFADRLGLHQSTISRLETGEMEIDKRTRLAVRALLADSAGGTGHAAGTTAPGAGASPDSGGDDIGSMQTEPGGFPPSEPQGAASAGGENAPPTPAEDPVGALDLFRGAA